MFIYLNLIDNKASARWGGFTVTRAFDVYPYEDAARRQLFEPHYDRGHALNCMSMFPEAAKNARKVIAGVVMMENNARLIANNGFLSTTTTPSVDTLKVVNLPLPAIYYEIRRRATNFMLTVFGDAPNCAVMLAKAREWQQQHDADEVVYYCYHHATGNVIGLRYRRDGFTLLNSPPWSHRTNTFEYLLSGDAEPDSEPLSLSNWLEQRFPAVNGHFAAWILQRTTDGLWRWTLSPADAQGRMQVTRKYTTTELPDVAANATPDLARALCADSLWLLPGQQLIYLPQRYAVRYSDLERIRYFTRHRYLTRITLAASQNHYYRLLQLVSQLKAASIQSLPDECGNTVIATRNSQPEQEIEAYVNHVTLPLSNVNPAWFSNFAAEHLEMDAFGYPYIALAPFASKFNDQILYNIYKTLAADYDVCHNARIRIEAADAQTAQTLYFAHIRDVNNDEAGSGSGLLNASGVEHSQNDDEEDDEDGDGDDDGEDGEDGDEDEDREEFFTADLAARTLAQQIAAQRIDASLAAISSLF